MLDYLNTIFQAFSLSISIVVIIAIVFFYKQNKNVIFIYYGFFMFSFIYMMGIEIFLRQVDYVYDPFNNSLKLKTIEFINQLSDYTALITSPLFFIYLIPIKFKNKLYIFFSSLFIINVILEFIMIYINPEMEHFFVFINNTSLAFMLIFIIIFLLTQYKKIESQDIKKFLRFASFIFAFFLPFILLFDIMKMDLFINPEISDFDFDICFFITWNLASIVFFLKYLNSYAMNSFIITPSHTYLKKIGLSEREREVFQLLIKGFSYKEMAEKLFISSVTVKTHVLNIYKKANVKNKIALLYKIKETYV